MKNTNKKKLLEAAGWRVGSTDDFLNLTDAEAAYIDLKITLSKKVRHTHYLLALPSSTICNASNSCTARRFTCPISMNLDATE